MDGAHGDHAGLHGVFLPGDEGLQGEDGPRREDDGIHRGVGRGAVTALAEEGDVHAVHVGVGVALHPGDLACGDIAAVVDGQGEIGPRKPGEEAVGDHGPGAAHGLLRGLGHQDQGPAPAVLQAAQDRGGAGQGGHVEVVAAGVHDAGYLAGVGQSCLLLHGQRVQFRAEEQGRALAVPQHAHHAGAAHAGGDIEAGLPHLVRHLHGGLHFLAGQLRMLMKVEVEGIQCGIEPVQFAPEWLSWAPIAPRGKSAMPTGMQGRVGADA